MGLLNAIVPRDQLLDKAYEYARRITANAPLAVQATKQSVWEGLGMSLRDAYKNESAAQLDDLPDRGRQGRPEGVRGKSASRTGRGSNGGGAVDPRTPCLIGVGQQTWHPEEVGDAGAPEPLVDVGGGRPRRRRRHGRRRAGRARPARRPADRVLPDVAVRRPDGAARGAPRRRAAAQLLLGHRRDDAAGAGERSSGADPVRRARRRVGRRRRGAGHAAAVQDAR